MEKKLSFVIPCYNSATTLEAVVTGITQSFDERGEYDYEFVLVNDASTDGTFEVIQKLCETDARITGIDFAKNRGQHAAIMAGLAHSTGDLVFSIDDDGQTPTEAMHSMLEKLDKGYDVVCAYYEKRLNRTPFRRIGSKLNRTMRRWLLEIPKGVRISVFFVAQRFVVDEMLKYKNPYPYISGLLIRTTDRIGNVAVVQKERISGSSGYSFTKLFSLWLNGFTAFSVKPLRISTFVGLVSATIGVVVAIVLVISRLVNPSYVAGWISTIALTLIIGGITMFMLGLLGEYIGRMYISINESPQYVIRKIAKGTFGKTK
ncbi:MAG: glycosyltransferase family 2 protein [Clostridiales bacterium]|nr:glycosyltransferase family 2 protein [Clostridiales bacterium]